jgi:hypothetical protein
MDLSSIFSSRQSALLPWEVKFVEIVSQINYLASEGYSNILKSRPTLGGQRGELLYGDGSLFFKWITWTQTSELTPIKNDHT